MPASPSAPPPSAPQPRLFATLRQDVRTVGGEWFRSGIRASVGRTFDDLEAFYLSTEHRQRLARMGRLRRWFFLSLWLIKSLFLNLTAARRVLLLAALLVISMQVNVGRNQDGGGSIRIPVIGASLLLLVLMLELKDKLLARNELEAGRAVQRALVPARAPTLEGWDAWLHTRPANDVGGDLVDSLDLGDGRLALVLADVAGKGLPAALLMAKLQATIRALAPDASSLEAFGAQLNRILHRDGLPSSFSTMAYLEIEIGSGRVRLLNAGHMPPLLLRAGAAPEELPRGGAALALLATATYQQQEFELRPGHTVVVFSDGVTEAMNEAGDFFGDERLRSLLATLAGRSARVVAEEVMTAVDAFVGRAAAHDDVSLVVLHRLAQGVVAGAAP